VNGDGYPEISLGKKRRGGGELRNIFHLNISTAQPFPGRKGRGRGKVEEDNA